MLIFKKGKRQDVNNHWSISIFLLSLRCLKKIIYDLFYRYLNDNDLLANCQSGYKSFHGILMSLLEASNSWCVNIDNGHTNGIKFIDWKMPATPLTIRLFLRKLTGYSIEQGALNWFHSYLRTCSEWWAVWCVLLPVISHGEVFWSLVFIWFILTTCQIAWGKPYHEYMPKI